MEKELVFAKEGKLFLDTSMTASSFAKSRTAEKLTKEGGLLARHSGEKWTFSPWYFTESQEGAESVNLCGPAFYGKTLKNIFEKEDDQAKRSRQAALVCSVIEESKKQDKNLPQVGGEGIFISEDEVNIIFLPAGLFSSACQCRGGESQAARQGFYVNPKLSGKKSASFTQAVIAYRALSGNFPFANPDEEQREEDILDGNFKRISRLVFALNNKLASFIDSALLAGNSKKEGKAEDFPLTDFYKELGLTENGLIPIGGKVLPVIRKSSVSPEEFEEASRREEKKFNLKLSAKRWFRKNKIAVYVGTGVFLALIIGVLLGLKNMGNKPTTKSLNAFETAEAFYSAYNALDINSASSCVTGKKLNSMVDVIGQLYVSGKARAAYNPKAQTVTPAEWLNFNQQGHFYMWGLAQFAINAHKGELYARQPLVKEVKEAVAEEGGVKLKGGETKIFTITYNLIHSELSEGDQGKVISTLKIEEYSDTVNMIFKKDRWLINSLDSHLISEKEVNQEAFYADFTHLLEKHSGNVILAANELRLKYPWISDNSEIYSAQEKISSQGIF